MVVDFFSFFVSPLKNILGDYLWVCFIAEILFIFDYTLDLVFGPML